MRRYLTAAGLLSLVLSLATCTLARARPMKSRR